MSELDRITVRIRAVTGHPFSGREGSIPAEEWDPDMPLETECMVRLKQHPATIKVPRWMLDWQRPETGEWVLCDLEPALPEVLPPPDVDNSLREAVMQALGGRLGGGGLPAMGMEEPEPAPQPAGHMSPQELAEQIVIWQGGDVVVLHDGVAVNFPGSTSTCRALCALVAGIITQARADGAAAASPGGSVQAARLSKLCSTVDGMEVRLVETQDTLGEVQAGLALVRTRAHRENDELMGRINALETRSAELESKLRAQLTGGGVRP